MAMVSRPSFDPSQFGRGIDREDWEAIRSDKRNPLRDRNIQEHYPPGSTFKVIAAITGLEEGLINLNTVHFCSGKFKFGRRTFHCWKKYGHQNVNLYKALRESCNVYFYKMSTQLDIDILAKYASAFGMGKKTGIALPREVSGLIPTKEWKLQRSGVKWQHGETLSCVIGQSYVLATPLQIAQMFSVVANGGTLYRPYLVQEIFTNSGEVIERFWPQIRSRVEISEKTLKAVRKGLFQVVNHPKGTAFYRRGAGLQMAGKTGTSQVMRISAERLYDKCENLPIAEKRHGLFAAFAPYHDSRIAVAAVVEHGCSGSGAAAPLVAAVVEVYMKKYHPEKHEKIKEQEKRERQRMVAL